MARHCSHRQSSLIKAYAAAEGLGARAAQIHRKKNDPRWVAFLQTSGAAGESSHGAALVPGRAALASGSWSSRSGSAGNPSEADEEFAGLGLEEEAVKRHEALWRASARAARDAADRGDGDKSAYFSQIATHNYRSLTMARKDLERAQIVSRNLIPASEFSEFAELLHRVAILGRGIVRELGELVNPDRPEVGIAVLTQWVETRWNPAIDDLITVARGERPDDGIRQAA